MTSFGAYLDEIRKNLAHGDATEHTHRPALKKLLELVGQGIIATNEPTRILCGAPDFILTKDKIPLGHVETKDVGENLAAMEKGKPPSGEQFGRYLDGLPNWILTDYLEFRWYVSGEHRMTVRLAELDGKKKLQPLPGGEKELANLLKAFLTQKSKTVGTAKDLAERMAGMTRIIRDLIIKTFEHEVEKGFLHKWLAAFHETLIPDLEEKQFADMFAQTLAYGLFAARVHTPVSKEFSREMAAYNLPKTNPFLRKLFSEIAGVDMPETIDWAVDDLVELLNRADMASVLKDFGKGKGKEDPVVHFYETFLAAYDPKMRELRGVFYTPGPAVSYIVRSVDHLLMTRFQRPKGLADENTLILDPATGTATFIYFIIDQIYQKFAKQKGAWDGYVKKHLLNRIFGFELLIAPYAIAHLKLGMQLADLGYKFGSDQRLGIYLTNTLEEAAKKTEQLFAGWVAEEANAATEIKRDKKIMVVIGNPPYSKVSSNRSEDENGEPTFIGKLLDDYRFVDGEPLGERNPKWLQDDYVKFIRFAQWRVERTGEGIIGFITNHGYLDNPTFRGLRCSLLKSFSEIFIYNLHGNARKQEKSPDGSSDVNVFDIQTGVAIVLCVKQKGKGGSARVSYADLWGSREGKYERLAETQMNTTDWVNCQPTTPHYLFLPQDMARAEEYNEGWLVTQIFEAYASTITTARNSLAIRWTKEDVWETVTDFASLPPEEARAKYNLGDDARDWKVELAQRDLVESGLVKDKIVPIIYRPFDVRYTYYTGKTRGFICMPRSEVMQHMFHENIAFLTHRPQSPSEFTFAYCTKLIGDQCVAANKSVGGGNSFQFPLYLYDIEKKKRGEWGGAFTMALFESSASYQTRRPNFTAAFLNALVGKLKLPQEKPHGLPNGVMPENIFHYAYAIFHCPAYRARFVEFLKIDFVRLPLTSNLKLFRTLAAKGAELVALHLMESPKLDKFITEFNVKGSNEVEKVQYTDNDQRVWINPKQFFDGVPKAVWEFHVGGYQVCEKWLKDRKDRKLTYEDIQHYQKTVIALNETIRLMAEIDETIEKQGGWPLK
jgi:predicted helicase